MFEINNRIILSVLAVLFIVLLAIAIRQPGSDKKPLPQTKSPEPQWYVVFSVKNQKATAYTEASQAPISSGGKEYALGTIAVHPLVPSQYGGDPRVPMIPFNTEIILSRPITIQGNEYDSLKVIDTGDINYRLWPEYPYWIDVFHGTTNYYSHKAALNYGTDLIDYYWVEKWR
ncbi:MAG: hypothetical protein PHD40_10150 [Syntrophomonadaceae bacterium]|nr:hypothetical protein [Syntrophomonadaceae bacterium]